MLDLLATLYSKVLFEKCIEYYALSLALTTSLEIHITLRYKFSPPFANSI